MIALLVPLVAGLVIPLAVYLVGDLLLDALTMLTDDK